MASDGGALLVAPGVTTFGTGSQTSVSAGFAWPAAGAAAAPCGAGAGACAERPAPSAVEIVNVVTSRK
jgi:hypothetical protein